MKKFLERVNMVHKKNSPFLWLLDRMNPQWGVISVKLSSQSFYYINRQEYCISHQVRAYFWDLWTLMVLFFE